MEKEFIPYQQALELKELGFDEPCLAYYPVKDVLLLVGLKHGSTTPDLINNTTKYPSIFKLEDAAAAPTFSQAFRWFREKYELFGEVIMYIPQEGDLDGCFTYISSISNVDNYSKNPKIDRTYYKSHEEAELACLIKLIEIVKTK